MKLFARRAVAAVREVTENTFVAPASSADFLPAHDFTFKPVIEMLSSKVVSASLGSPADVSGKKSADIDLKFWGKGSGTAGSPYPPFDAIMGACGLSGSSSGGSITYKPMNTTPDAAHFQGPCINCSVVGMYDGVLHKTPGVAGSMKWILEAGKKWEIEFAGKGLWTSAVDSALSQSSASPSTPIEPTVQNVSFLVNGYQLTIDKLEIDFGSEVQMYDDIDAPFGVGGFTINDRKPTGTFQALMVNVADHDFFGHTESNTVLSGSVTIGSAAGNKYVLTFASIIYSNVQYANKNGFIAVNATLKFNETDVATPWLTMVAE